MDFIDSKRRGFDKSSIFEKLIEAAKGIRLSRFHMTRLFNSIGMAYIYYRDIHYLGHNVNKIKGRRLSTQGICLFKDRDVFFGH